MLINTVFETTAHGSSEQLGTQRLREIKVAVCGHQQAESSHPERLLAWATFVKNQNELPTGETEKAGVKIQILKPASANASDVATLSPRPLRQDCLLWKQHHSLMGVWPTLAV